LARAVFSGENVREVNLPETGGALPELQRRRSQSISGSLPEVKKEVFISYRSFDTNAVKKKNCKSECRSRFAEERKNGM
jgi:hypothetical protein